MMKIYTQEKWVICGGSRGLGKSFSDMAKKQGIELLLISRKAPVSFDFTREEKWVELVTLIQSFEPTRIFYFSGGGPYGLYASKQWKDHEWAFKLNFGFPAFLLHSFLTRASARPERGDLSLKQIVLTGSSIAENKPDPGAASYAAAKHALRGLVTTLQVENQAYDIRLFSPGYMDTGLLPPNAWPRQQQNLVKDTSIVAQTLWEWIQNGDDANKCLS